MKKKVSIFNFSGIYKNESFYHIDKSSSIYGMETSSFRDVSSHDRKMLHELGCARRESFASDILSCAIEKEILEIDCSDIPGTNCMCDDAARESIRSIIEKNSVGSDEIHFIDSGNYHYMSAILLEKVQTPFSLVVLDHHPDMQAPMFGDILSCGGWVLDVIEKNEYVRDIHVIGADLSLIAALEEKDRNRGHFYEISDIFLPESIALPQTQFPVYLSIDKDVLSRDEIITNWDQGEMSFEQMKLFVEKVLDSGDVVGIDICGECAPDQEEIDIESAILKNDQVNQELLELITICEM
ncbi:arginase family protein [Butyrivibrio sp. YAB3001]|uniref:arginase family protein n=1 Tax=Butyrivibrio sp. YAB3001 TaxID=1520812 RepID=UPI0008F66FD3|nr:arginase family protein [Butyrivibrio sp. YAB3001]SFC43575.1 Arginase family enzyme [Butyrivibrio sp. YAB3001]